MNAHIDKIQTRIHNLVCCCRGNTNITTQNQNKNQTKQLNETKNKTEQKSKQ